MLSRLSTRLESTIGVSSQTLSCRLAGRNPGDIVTKALHKSNGLIVVRILEANLIRLQLIMETGLSERLFHGGVLVQDMPKILNGSGDDAAASCRSNDIVQGTIGKMFDDGGRD